MTDIQQAFEDVKKAKIEIASLEARKKQITDDRAKARQELAALEDKAATELEDVAQTLEDWRGALQRGLQKINDLPVDTNTVETAARADLTVEPEASEDRGQGGPTPDADALQTQAEGDLKKGAQAGPASMARGTEDDRDTTASAGIPRPGYIVGHANGYGDGHT